MCEGSEIMKQTKNEMVNLTTNPAIAYNITYNLNVGFFRSNIYKV